MNLPSGAGYRKIAFQQMHPRIPHPRIHDPGHIKGVRTVATVELTKGIIVVLAGLGLFSMRHRDIWGVAESFLDFLHVSPHHHHRFYGVFVALAHGVSDVRLWKIAVVASIYVILRFVEAYGLWHIRPWAEWLAFASGAIYIPFEAADLIHRPTWFRVLVIVVNVLIVLYMLMLRLEAAKKHGAARHSAQSG
jgi:uncharacterized membrane protein (DUF2068 family)